VLFMDRLEQAIAVARRKDEHLAVCFCDLDRFKEVNDDHGHAAGDAVLVEVARRIERAVRGSDTVARLSGDEFGLVLRGADDAAASIVARKLVDVISAPFDIGGMEATLGVSVGVSVYPLHGEGADALLQRADEAMYMAKQTGSDYRIAQPDMATERRS
jgi:diguanylate cyclase (GGDEF)-like protein